MRFSVIIAEYNPFHSGHKYHLDATKVDSTPVIVIMSGAFVQRGEVAIADKYLRALSAIKEGADIVIELPVPFSVSPAEKFAYGAMKTLSALSADVTLSFGSESGDKEKINNTSNLLKNIPESVDNAIKRHLKNGLSFPKSRALAIREYASANKIDIIDLTDPNDVLGVEYLLSASLFKSNFDYNVVKRSGDHSSLDADTYPSAMAIRNLLKEKSYDKALSLLPSASASSVEFFKNSQNNDCLILNAMHETDISTLFDVTEGIENRFKKGIYRVSSYEESLDRIKTARYTDSRIRRISLYSLLGITSSVYDACVDSAPIINVLAAKKEALKYLSYFDADVFFTQNELSGSDNVLAQLTAKSQEKFNLIKGAALWKSFLE